MRRRLMDPQTGRVWLETRTGRWLPQSGRRTALWRTVLERKYGPLIPLCPHGLPHCQSGGPHEHPNLPHLREILGEERFMMLDPVTRAIADAAAAGVMV